MIKELKRWFDTEAVRIIDDEFSMLDQRLRLLERKPSSQHTPVSGYTALPDEEYNRLEDDSFTHRMRKSS